MTTPERDQTGKTLIEFGVKMLEIVADTVVGYRKRLVDGGVTEATADEMALAFHDVLIEQMRSQGKGAQAGRKIGGRR